MTSHVQQPSLINKKKTLVLTKIIEMNDEYQFLLNLSCPFCVQKSDDFEMNKSLIPDVLSLIKCAHGQLPN